VTGAEHYARAEEILSTLPTERVELTWDQEIAEAQVHATLALTQATLVGMEAADWEKA
jgi:hypothetical protein